MDLKSFDLALALF